MMVREGSFAADGQAPIAQVAKECTGIAEPAEREKWSGADFFFGLQVNVSPKAAKSKQASRGGKHGELGKLSNRFKRARHSFRPCKNSKVSPGHAGKRLAQSSHRQ